MPEPRATPEYSLRSAGSKLVLVSRYRVADPWRDIATFEEASDAEFTLELLQRLS
jgi:hypothetical protein